jgi:hypothetical protein
MSDRHRVELVCSDRGQHRDIVLLAWKGPVPVREAWPARIGENWLDWPRRPGELRCPFCPRDPRPKPGQLPMLLEVAASRPDGRLDLSLLDL